MALNLLIVDDHLIIRRGLARILLEDPRVGQVDEAADAPSAPVSYTHLTLPTILLV